MPSRNNNEDDSGIVYTCKRCNLLRSILVVRNDQLCKDCFSKYVHTKVIKRMETYRVRNSAPGRQRTLLLPISFGVSSMTLLHILSQHLKRQGTKTGRTGYHLLLVHVDCSILESASNEVCKTSERLRLQYPGYELSIVNALEASIQVDKLRHVMNQPGNVSEMHGEKSAASLERIFRSLPSPSSRSDMLTILRRELIIQVAKNRECEAILWADSTTTLSEKILAETAKGRGFSLPWLTADREHSSGIHFMFPMRDLLKKELVSYADLIDPSLSSIIASENSSSHTSMKKKTIDELMKTYVHSVEEQYPSIVSNVLQTATKLKALDPSDDTFACNLCSMPITRETLVSQPSDGSQLKSAAYHKDVPFTKSSTYLCYGCLRATERSS